MLTKQNKWETDGLLAIRCLTDGSLRLPRARRTLYEVEKQSIPEIIAEVARVRAKRVRQLNVMSRLEEAANKGNETAFLKALTEINWQDKTSAEFVQSIKLAFRAGAFTAARCISIEAMKYHSNEPEIQKYVRVLTLQSRETVAPQTPVNTRANRTWLEIHSGQYSGKWVALRNGELLGVAESVTTLVEEVRRKHDVKFPSKEIMVTTGY